LLAAGTATVVVKNIPYIRSLPVLYPAQADPRVLDLLKKAQTAANDAKTLTADFTYETKTPNGNKTDVNRDVGTVKLMKPNFADIQFNLTGRYGQHIVSDGTNLWKYRTGIHSYTRGKTDPEGKNINVWRLIIIGGFFDVETWIHNGIYVDSLNELSYAGVETLNGTQYQVLEHRMIGTTKGKTVPFDQKIYFGPDNLIHRFTLDFTWDGKPGSEAAELTNIRTGEAIAPANFIFVPPSGSKEAPFTP
jgi:outer membrane lipoprotein-sorting protein